MATTITGEVGSNTPPYRDLSGDAGFHHLRHPDF